MEIKLHENSKKYIIDTLSQYVEKQYNGEVIEQPVVHMYAKSDTYDEDGTLNGYRDSLFCEVHVYDTKNDFKYVFINKDGVTLLHANIWQVRVFKDGSTMLILNGSHKLEVFQALELFKC